MGQADLLASPHLYTLGNYVTVFTKVNSAPQLPAWVFNTQFVTTHPPAMQSSSVCGELWRNIVQRPVHFAVWMQYLRDWCVRAFMILLDGEVMSRTVSVSFSWFGASFEPRECMFGLASFIHLYTYLCYMFISGHNVKYQLYQMEYNLLVTLVRYLVLCKTNETLHRRSYFNDLYKIFWCCNRIMVQPGITSKAFWMKWRSSS